MLSRLLIYLENHFQYSIDLCVSRNVHYIIIDDSVKCHKSIYKDLLDLSLLIEFLYYVQEIN